jgi:flagellar protein FlaF
MMNPTRVYEEMRAESQSGRELEASLLQRAARKLGHCIPDWPERGRQDFEAKLEEALLFNQKLWTLLQVELSSPENPLEPRVRRNLLQLSHYVDRKTLGLFSGGVLKDLQILIRINQEIAAGLMSDVSKLEDESSSSDELVGDQDVLNITA